MKSTIFAIVGFSGSGKTSLVRLLEKNHSMYTISYRSLLRKFILPIGYDGVQDYFSKVDARCFRESLDDFALKEILSVIQRTSLPIVVDGLYSSFVYKSLKSSSDIDVKVIYINASSNIRLERLEARVNSKDGARDEELTRNGFKRVLGIELVIQQADYEINGNNDFEDVYCDLEKIVQFSLGV